MVDPSNTDNILKRFYDCDSLCLSFGRRESRDKLVSILFLQQLSNFCQDNTISQTFLIKSCISFIFNLSLFFNRLPVSTQSRVQPNVGFIFIV